MKKKEELAQSNATQSVTIGARKEQMVYTNELPDIIPGKFTVLNEGKLSEKDGSYYNVYKLETGAVTCISSGIFRAMQEDGQAVFIGVIIEGQQATFLPNFLIGIKDKKVIGALA